MTVRELNRDQLHELKQAYYSELVNEGTFAEVMGVNINELKEKIKEHAEKGYRNCIVSFYSHPYGYRDFIEKYGEENKEHYKLYNIETELREYFTKNGFTFKIVTDDICGGVRQDPYWIICW